MKLARNFIIFIVGILSAGSLRAQTVDCRHRTVLVNILDSNNQVVNDIRPEDLSGSFRRKAVKITSVAPNSFLPRVFIVLDASESMTDFRSTWKYSIEAADRLVDSMPVGAFVGMIIFAKNIEKTIPFGNSAAEIKEALEKLRVAQGPPVKNGRATALWDALDQAISEMQPAKEGDAIYAITDGMDNTSKINAKTVGQAFLVTGIRLFSFSVDNPENHPILANHARGRDFQYLVSDSGGFATRIPYPDLGTRKPLDPKDGRLSDQEALFTAQLHQIFYYQRVGIVLPEQPEKAGEWSLNFKGQKVRDPQVVYPHMLDACTEAKTAINAAH
jgi:Mg-chelatase subunit ChlD